MSETTLMTVALADLTPHPRNYRVHPSDQIAHLAASIAANGIYRNVVAARDLTLLAGHGVVQAAASIGYTEIAVRVLDLDPHDPRALKILAGDNEVQHLVESDDRALSELLRTINADHEVGLLGTGYDEMMLANLVFVTRNSDEIESFDEAAEWVGLPEYESTSTTRQLIFSFASDADRADLVARLNLPIKPTTRSVWWPPRIDEDPATLGFVVAEALPR